ncbi:hypothetical protein [Sorangium atrum]|uniref:Alpha/beta hydrolase family protein n=1 Tax=Sorangium atrum TaxID=2995308 RepID=A0ABT5BYJ1_9BACT|nr:hypothetical protein [Sorangium aterium]MDC0679209.1 hypothetical protein [Sorangium aterium]
MTAAGRRAPRAPRGPAPAMRAFAPAMRAFAPAARAFALAAGLAAASSPGAVRAQPKPAPAAPAPAASTAAAAQLDGATYDYEHPSAPARGAAEQGAAQPDDAGPAVPPERRWRGRAFVHRLAAADPARPLPILVFLHGTNEARIEHRWMGGGPEGDVRRIAAQLMEAGRIPPMLVAAPSAVLPAAVAVARTSWPAFDLDAFLDATAARLRGVATVDRARVVVAGHSGGGCNKAGGIAAALSASTPVHAALVIDTCMDVDIALPLARSRPTTHVVVSWQTMTWVKRPIADFRRAFQRGVDAHPAAPGVLRELEPLIPTEPMPHDAMVPLVLRRWLPPLLSPDAAPSVPCVSP